MEPTDAELYSTLLEQLTETGDVVEDREAGVIHLNGLPGQRAPSLRLHLTPELLGRVLRDLAPDYREQFPLLSPSEGALVAFYIQILAAVEEAGTRGRDIRLCPPGADLPHPPR